MRCRGADCRTGPAAPGPAGAPWDDRCRMPTERTSRTRAVFLDALGTLVKLDAPWPALARGLAERHDVEVSLEDARRAMLTEMAHYRANCVRAGDPDSLARLRLECAEILRLQLAPALSGLDAAAIVSTMLDALSFSAYDDAVGALERWRETGLQTVVVSNWDISLHDVLAAIGLRDLLDGVVCSAEVGVSKPASAPFERALELAGVLPEQVVHIGDSVAEDVAGARAAGIEAVLLDRGASGLEPPAGVRVIASLREW